jgi:hypothetical protein
MVGYAVLGQDQCPVRRIRTHKSLLHQEDTQSHCIRRSPTLHPSTSTKYAKSGSINNDHKLYILKMIMRQHKKNFHPTMWENSVVIMLFVCIIGGHHRNGERDTGRESPAMSDTDLD